MNSILHCLPLSEATSTSGGVGGVDDTMVTDNNMSDGEVKGRTGLLFSITSLYE